MMLFINKTLQNPQKNIYKKGLLASIEKNIFPDRCKETCKDKINYE